MIVLCTSTTLVLDLPLQCSVEKHYSQCIMEEDCMNVHLKHKLSVSACFRLRRTLLPSKLPSYSIQTLLRKQCAIALSQITSLSSALLYLDLLGVNGRISSPTIYTIIAIPAPYWLPVFNRNESCKEVYEMPQRVLCSRHVGAL